MPHVINKISTNLVEKNLFGATTILTNSQLVLYYNLLHEQRSLADILKTDTILALNIYRYINNQNTAKGYQGLCTGTCPKVCCSRSEQTLLIEILLTTVPGSLFMTI